MKVRDIFGLAPTKGEVGIEIEMEGNRLIPERNIPGWDMKPDGSLRGESVEYVLRSPCSRDSVLGTLNTLSDTLAKNKATLRPSERCGVHIHINCQELTQEEVFRFITMYMVFEGALIHWCGPSREGNLFCLRTQDAEQLLMQLVEAKKSGRIDRMNSNNFRYAGVNVTSLAKFGSLEFRSLETPANFGTIATWANILLRIKDQALAMERSEDMIEAMSFEGVANYSRRVLGYTAFNLLFTPEFERQVMDGMRRAQFLAYTPMGKQKQTSSAREFAVQLAAALAPQELLDDEPEHFDDDEIIDEEWDEE